MSCIMKQFDNLNFLYFWKTLKAGMAMLGL